LEQELKHLVQEQKEIAKKICRVGDEQLKLLTSEKLETFRFKPEEIQTILSSLEECGITLAEFFKDEEYDVLDHIETRWKPLLFVKQESMPDHGRVCCAQECWYNENKDRIDEWTHTFYNAAAPTQVFFCNVCIDNMTEEEIDVATEQEMYALRSILKNQLKEFLLI
jgi:hypothetical protein